MPSVTGGTRVHVIYCRTGDRPDCQIDDTEAGSGGIHKKRDALQRIKLPEHTQRGLPAGFRECILGLHLHHLSDAGGPEDIPVRLIIHVGLLLPGFE